MAYICGKSAYSLPILGVDPIFFSDESLFCRLWHGMVICIYFIELSSLFEVKGIGEVKKFNNFKQNLEHSPTVWGLSRPVKKGLLSKLTLT